MKVSIRNLFGWVVANMLIMAGSVRREKKRALNTACILSIYFHKPSKKEFEHCIRWLQKNNFNFLSIQDLERIIHKEIPFPKGGVLLTVDDGWQSNESNIVEVANRYCVPVSLFISTEPVEEGNFWWSYLLKAKQYGLKHFSKKALKKVTNEERLLQINAIRKEISLEREAMTVNQVKSTANSKYVTIGGHTHTHPILINCNDDHVYHELSISRQKLESWTGKEVPYFSYPNGDYSMREFKILKNLRYRLAFSTEPKYLTPDLLNDNYNLPRFLFLDNASFAENICRIVGIWQTLMPKFRFSGFIKTSVKFSKKRGYNDSNADLQLSGKV